jgi:glycosyltransferase involved in cell wall biosynthesis
MPHDLACVVLSLRNEPGLIPAVQSLLAQGIPIEIVVVNSGGGAPEETLRRAGIRAQVIAREERLNPGAARNLGIAATRAPYIAFLAADCLAEPGWAAGRLREHGHGALAVASAVTNAYPHSWCAWASYIMRFSGRVPGIRVPQHRRRLYGVSYARELFERCGLFREDLRTGEDTEFNSRLAGNVPIRWAPDVRAAHRHPTNLIALLSDQYRRGVGIAHALYEIRGTPHHWGIAWDNLVGVPRFIKDTWLGVDPQYRRRLIGASLLLPLAAPAYALGALLTAWRRRPLAAPLGLQPQDAKSQRLAAPEDNPFANPRPPHVP